MDWLDRPDGAPDSWAREQLADHPERTDVVLRLESNREIQGRFDRVDGDTVVLDNGDTTIESERIVAVAFP